MSTATTEPTESHALQCMEIWGGNRAVDTAISVHGIDAWVTSEPHDGSEAGGDIHYISMCGGGRISRFAVADVAGHGQHVEGVASDLRGLMRKHINRVDQTRFARSINAEFSALSADGTFATAVLLTYFAPTDQLITCNAGHPAPVWYRVEEGRWQLLDHELAESADQAVRLPFGGLERSNLPLGLIEPTDYHQFAVPLARGDLILAYTDSLIEAQDPKGEPLGYEGLLGLVKGLDASRPDRFNHALLEALSAYRGGAPADDDVTVLLLHHNAANPPRQSLGEMAKVIAKMIGLVKV